MNDTAETIESLEKPNRFRGVRVSTSRFLTLTLLAFALAFTASPAIADLVSVDAWSVGDGKITRDTATKLDWLDLTVTNGHSIDDINAGFGSLLADGFRLPTLDQVAILFSHAGKIGSPYDTSPRAQDIPAAESFLSLFGCTLCDVYGINQSEWEASWPDRGGIFVEGIVLSPSNGYRLGSAQLNGTNTFGSDLPGPTANFGVLGIDQASPPFSFQHSQLAVGVFLVRETPPIDALLPGMDPSPQFRPVIVPQVTGTLGNGGWYRSNVSVSWRVTDTGFDIASSTGCTPTMITADTAGLALTCSATNTFGFSTTVPVSIKVDKTPPAILGMPAPGCSMWPPNGQMINVAMVTFKDALSGLDPNSIHLTGTSSDPSKGAVVITGGPTQYGIQLKAAKDVVYTLTATATDLAGNVATLNASCSVPHDQSGKQ